jgi:hypothetical protein
MKCPKCKFEQPVSDTCTHCGIIFSRFKELQVRKVAKDIRPSLQPKNSIGENIFFFSMGLIFVSILFTRSIYFLEFPADWDIYFRLLTLPALVWLTIGAVPRAANLLKGIENNSDKKYGLDGLEVYKKKTIFILMGLGSLMLLYASYFVLTGSAECFSGRYRNCHEIYDSVADTGEFWSTILTIYFVSLIPLTTEFMGLQIRRDRQ